MAEISKTTAVHRPNFAASSGHFPPYDGLSHGDKPMMMPREGPELPQSADNLHAALDLDQETRADMQIEYPHGGGDESSTETSDSPRDTKKATLPVRRRRKSGRSPLRSPLRKAMKATKETKTKMKAKMKTKIANAKEVWEVEEVVGSLIEADTYIHYYEVKWKGYSSKENTWGPKKNLQTCQEAIERFEQAR